LQEKQAAVFLSGKIVFYEILKLHFHDKDGGGIFA
jgi:hypothetical protein